jgi:hypothetical protein
MEEVERTYKALDDLCTAIHEFQTTEIDDSRYRAPIIDHFHPEDYCQKGVAGLSRFYSHCRAERDYVEGVSLLSFIIHSSDVRSQVRVADIPIDPTLCTSDQRIYDKCAKPTGCLGGVL